MTKKKETKNKKGALRLLIINLAAMVAVVIAAVFITFRWIDNYTEHGIAIKVVDVTGMQEEEAIQALSKHDLMGITSDHIFVKGVPAGEVISQRPAGNAKVKRGRKIYLTVSSGNHPMITVPDIADNSSLRQAESRLRAAGFQLTPHDTIDGELDWVYGIRYNGRELNGEEKIPEGSTLTLIIGGGDKIKADTLGVPTVEEGWF
ncbi:MAG: PASTA domain-containing protein [Bacteroidaceae bacterium]|nr:PASTA domain-containing protein [Bacteroidaceae bacterium]